MIGTVTDRELVGNHFRKLQLQLQTFLTYLGNNSKTYGISFSFSFSLSLPKVKSIIWTPIGCPAARETCVTRNTQVGEAFVLPPTLLL